MSIEVLFSICKGLLTASRNCRLPFPAYALILLTALAVLTSLNADVRSNCLPPPQSSDLNNLIDGLQRKYSRMQGLGADFVQVYRGSDGRIIREAGQLLLRRPGKARWEYSAPERKLFLSDGKNVFFYVYG